jgi:hypothetical protein
MDILPIEWAIVIGGAVVGGVGVLIWWSNKQRDE